MILVFTVLMIVSTLALTLAGLSVATSIVLAAGVGAFAIFREV